MNQQELMAAAVKQWGADSQLDMVIEECSELIKAIIKYRRGQGTVADIIEERVDVGLTLDQIDLIFPTASLSRHEIETEKLARLERLLGRK